jgi:hypothetical protein
MFFLLALTGVLAHGEEGMWLPEQVPQVTAKYADLKVSPEVLSDPTGPILGSVVSLGGCSGSFVSADGLIVTNHHCVEGYLQSISDEDNNRWRDGFVATTRDNEAPTGPAGQVLITQAQTDVTVQMMEGLTRRTPDDERAKRLESNEKALVSACESEAKDRRCRVATFDQGGRFMLIQRRQLKDLRVVWAPPRSVGQFGGDIDNWEWPRHGFDTALLRVYVAPDGSSADFSEDNIPYEPDHFLAMSPGVKQGDLTFVAGYPGRTRRNRLARELAFDIDEDWSRMVEHVDRIIPILDVHAATSEEASARLGPSISGMENMRKNLTGVLEGIQRSNGIDTMTESEDKILAWIRSDKKRKRAYEKVYEDLATALDEQRQAAEEDRLANGIRWASDLLGVATRAVRWAEEREKADADRKPGFQDRDEAMILRRFERLERQLHLPSEREILADAIARYLAGEDHQRWPSFDAWLEGASSPEAAVNDLYGDAPALAETETRVGLLEMSLEDLRAHDDPFIKLALSIESDAAPRREASKVRGAKMQRLRSNWSQAERAFADYSGVIRSIDANGTLRLTFGHVRGYAPEDGLWARPFSTLNGFAAKTGPAPFDAPAALIEAAREGPESKWAAPTNTIWKPVAAELEQGRWVTQAHPIRDVPIDFLADLDTTGGNSGSPCLDAEGRLAGLLFDGVWESVANDYVYDDATNRSIVADIRGLGWLLSNTEGTVWIAEEMGLTR